LAAADEDESRPHRWLRQGCKVLLGAAALLSAAIVVIGAGVYVFDQYDRRIDWRDNEYDRLRRLHAGYTLDRFKAELGTPVFARASADERFREDTFRRRDHWVQAVSDQDGTVVLYSVTSCDEGFRPTFNVPDLDVDSASLTLRRSNLDDVVSRESDALVVNDYRQGVTANTTYIDESYGGNPSNYKTFAWGVNDACAEGQRSLEEAHGRSGYPRLDDFPYRRSVRRANDSVRRFRASAVVNTYAETAPLVPIRRVRRAFQVGVDRLLTRTAD